jgi:hypothetical protein
MRQRIVEWHFREPRGSFYSWLGVTLGCVLIVVGSLFVEALPISPVLLDSPADRGVGESSSVDSGWLLSWSMWPTSCLKSAWPWWAG